MLVDGRDAFTTRLLKNYLKVKLSKDKYCTKSIFVYAQFLSTSYSPLTTTVFLHVDSSLPLPPAMTALSGRGAPDWIKIQLPSHSTSNGIWKTHADQRAYGVRSQKIATTRTITLSASSRIFVVVLRTLFDPRAFFPEENGRRFSRPCVLRTIVVARPSQLPPNVLLRTVVVQTRSAFFSSRF